MKKNTFLIVFILTILSQSLFAQSMNYWLVKKESQALKTRLRIDKKNIPNKYKVLSLDFKSLQTNLKSASKRSQNNKLATTLLLDFPTEDGTMETFSIEKTSVLAPELEAKYPEIQSYYGVSNKNPLNKIYISTSPAGFTGLITGNKTIYIDPFSKNDVSNYIVYDRKDCSRNPDDAFVCNAVMDEALSKSKTSANAKTSSTTDGNLRTYRLALACTSAYSLYYGNTIANVLAAMNTTITRVNSVYRRDLSVVFQLVASNDRLIYINGFNKDASPDPDPYDNYNGSGMLSVNTSNITGLITVGAYDIGHVFSTGGGGVASPAPCGATTKGRGVTGIVTPQFDPFDIDYVAHEIGHQFGAAHTYYNACFGAAKDPANDQDYEPGSGSTIMAYAGICAPNVQDNSDAYFHARSIEQMTTAIGGHSCVTGTSTGNAAPVVAAITARTIPKSTPFILTGSATDANTADAMTYTWEQYDNNDGGVQPPTSTNTVGPVFKSLMPTSDPTRTFPNLAAIISNTTPTWEVLPSVARTLNFRLTVRDNSTLGGRTDYKAVAITVGTAGPFLVSTPNAGTEIWYAGETKAVTWNVASTNTATYSTTVNIKLSTDGGNTYPITLATGVANNGTANITVPNNVGKLNRIKVEAAANIFFDISNANFEIKSGKFEMTSTASTQSVCKPTNAVYTINYTTAPTFSETTTFSAVGAPIGSTITFSPTTRSTSGPFTMTVSNTSGVAAGNYPITIKGTSTTANIDFPVLLNVFDSTIGNVTLTSPSNGATNQQTSSLLQWNPLASASSYLVQISTSPTFATITESATVTGTSYQTTLLAQGTVNYWRVKPINSCTTGSFSEVYVFQIASDLCKTYSNATFEPDAVWEIGSNNAVSAKINIPDNIVISDVNFYMKGTHAALSDLKMQFSGPTGIFAEIYNRDCSAANFDVTFDDSGSALPVPCSVTLSGIKQASQSLSKFNGSSSLGTWTLLATDRVSATSGGTFTNFSVIICGKLQIVNNIAVSNNALALSQGATATISQAKLAATQPTATTSQLIYTITQLPINGTLKLNNVAVVVGGTFTQADINTNLLSYTNNGGSSTSDTFKFSINGINLALLGGQTFNINVCGAPIPNAASLTAVNSQCAATPAAPTATSTCYGTITGTTATVFPITTQGTTVVTWTFNDGNGQSVTANQNVIIDDTIAPTIPTLANVTAQCSATPIAPTTTDACKGTITGTTATVFPITTQGTTAVTWTFNDGNGQSVTANQNVIIDDTIAPTIPTLSNVTAQCSATPVAPTTTDACAGTITGTTATVFPITTQGTTVVTWTFNDGNGQSVTANQNVIIDESIAPVIPILANVTAQCAATPIAPTTNACSGIITGTTLTAFPITTQGTTVVTWTFNYGNAQFVTANQNVIIDDTIAPAIPTLANVTAQCAATPVAPTTTDACAGTITGTTATVFPITTQGTTVVTWTFNDGNGQSVTANQNVIIDDTIAPAIPTLDNVTAQCAATPVAPTTTDACAGTITGTTATVFPITTQGTTVVTWTFNDGNGQSVTANQNVIIDDTIAPPIPTLADVTAQCSATPVAPTTTDACAGTITGTTETVFPITTQGTTVVTWTFNDGNGQSVTANQNVIIDDTIAPTIPTLADVTAQCSATPVAPTTTDACVGTITGTTATLFPITTQGTTVVTWTFNDGNGQSVTANQNVIINNSMSAVISGTSTTCAGTNANLLVIIAGGVAPYTVVYTNGTSNFTINNYTSGSSIVVSPTVTTTYSLVSVYSAEGCSSVSNSGSAVISSGTTTWNGSIWSNGVPTSITSAIISGNYSVATNITACTLTINNNAIVSIPSGYNVTLNGALTVSSGSFTLNNNANLIQTSNVANSGNIIVKRNGSPLLRLDYTLWSSPVTNNTSQFLQSFSPNTSTNRFYFYDTPTNFFTTIANPSTTNFSLGKGYLIRMPNDASSTIRENYPGIFTGVPNNGIIPITMTNLGAGKRFNLIGNPYPSPISMTQFVADNSTKITGTLYFWRKTNGLTNPTYCTWLNGIFTSNGEPQVVNPNGIIQTGQGFFVEALNSATTVTFNNGQRIANNANQFFKTKAIERNTIWLNATSTTGNFSQMAVSYATDATQGVDDFDGKYYNDGAIALNSFLDNTDYVIQSRALPFDGTDEVPLSFKATNSGNYTIAIDHVDGLFSGSQEIILKDNITGKETNLKTDGYTFSALAGLDNSRFLLKYQKTLGINKPTFDENSLAVSNKNGIINIKSKGTSIDNVKLYDIRGRLLFEKANVNDIETSIESSKYAKQVLIIQITSVELKVVKKKIAI
ncbi:reprolysin-like metallopeptidase [Flavobacterium sp.]|uniref:reprolysin-like metallopeptidase n=1 Tax=Flavobacterium sp. TaxID=239 RepID=UPI00286D868C|nr:zinc-dependent metalloprotease family protein [Flavobacterium sp.]